MRVPITRIDGSLPLPDYATDGAAAFDLLCRSAVTVAPGAIEYVPANIIVRVPNDYVLIVSLRSSTPKRKGLLSPHGIGVIDRDYCGPDDEVKIQVYNFSSHDVTVERGERIAQALLLPAARCEWEERPPAEHANRGGFGSTG